MPRLTVTDRLLAKLAVLLEERGTAATLAKVSEANERYHLAPGEKPRRKLSPAVISMIKNRLRKPQLDDLDELAAFFRISIGELTGSAQPGELSGDEQRMVHAFRVLPPTVQDHFLAIIESMSVGTRIAGRAITGRTVEPARGVHGDTAIPSASAPFPPDVRQHITDVLVELLHLVSPEESRRQAANTGGPLPRPPNGAGETG